MDNLKIRIDSLAFGGNGVGRHEGIVYFVPYSAPGDLLEVGITREEKRYREARIIKIIEPSEARRKAPCPYFGECGGCQWQHVDYKTQTSAKISELKSALIKSGLGSEAQLVNPITASPSEYGYRRMARFKIYRNTDNNAALGFYRRNSREPVEIDKCILLDDRINEYLSRIDKDRTGLVGIDLFLDTDGEVKPFYRSSERDPGADFIQVNSEINNMMKSFVGKTLRRELQQTGTLNGPASVIDLYCGDGNLSLQFADIASHISGWDSSRVAIERGRLSAEALSAGSSCRIRFHQGDVGKSWKQIAGFAGRTDCAIVDPPRKGLKKNAGRLAGLNIPLIIYISCSPPDLVRDLTVFKRFGYEIVEIQPFDMFPQTYHLETAAVIKKRS